MEAPRVRLGELLVRAGLISAEQLEEALVLQRQTGGRLGTLLVESGLVSETQVTQVLSQQLSVPWVSLHHIDFPRELLARVPVELVERFCLIPIYVRRVRGLGDALYVAMDDPTNGQALQEVAERSGLHVRAMIAPPSDIREAIREAYGVGGAPPPPPATAVLEPEPASTSLASLDAEEITGVHASDPADPDDDEDVPTGIHSRDLIHGAKPLPADAPPARPPEPAVLPRASVSVSPLPPPPRSVPVVPPRSSPLSAPPPISAPALPPSPPRSSPMSAPPPERLAPRSTRPEPSAPASAPPPRRSSSPEDASSHPPARSSSSPSIERSRQSTSNATKGFRAGAKPGERARASAPGAGARRMMSLTLLDGTTVKLTKAEGTPAVPPPAATPTADGLTARDIVAALRAAARGVDASDVLGENARWEAIVASLLSLLLRKRLITEEEFVAELEKGR